MLLSRRIITLTAVLGFIVVVSFFTVKYDGHVALESAARSLTGQEKKPAFSTIQNVVYNRTRVQEEAKFAYVQYTTDLDYLCNAVSFFFFSFFFLFFFFLFFVFFPCPQEHRESGCAD